MPCFALGINKFQWIYSPTLISALGVHNTKPENKLKDPKQWFIIMLKIYTQYRSLFNMQTKSNFSTTNYISSCYQLGNVLQSWMRRSQGMYAQVMSVLNMATLWPNFRRAKLIYLDKIKISWSNFKNFKGRFFKTS